MTASLAGAGTDKTDGVSYSPSSPLTMMGSQEMVVTVPRKDTLHVVAD